MEVVRTRSLSLSQWKTIYNLWNREYPKELNHPTIDSFRLRIAKWLDIHHYLVYDGTTIAGWLADFHRENERWFSVIVSPDYQGKGVGRKLMEIARQQNTTLNGWVVCESGFSKIDGTPYKSPLEFYKKIGFKVDENTVLDDEGIRAIKVHWEASRT